MAIPGEADYIFALHDAGGEYNMANKQRRGWLVLPDKIGHKPYTEGDPPPYLGDYRGFDGFGLIVRLNNDYARSLPGRPITDGTIPFEVHYDAFAKRAAEFVKGSLGTGSQGAHIWIVGNESNHVDEWPRRSADDPEKITPEMYARCYAKVWQAIKGVSREHKVVVQAVAPYTQDSDVWGDWLDYYVKMLVEIKRLLSQLDPVRGEPDGIALHVHYFIRSTVDLLHGRLPSVPSVPDVPGIPQQHAAGVQTSPGVHNGD